MQAQDIIQRIESSGVVAILRASSSGELVDVVKALCEGGLTCIEVTMTTPNALAVIEEARSVCGETAAIGVGTVLDTETARAAILAGAQFVVTPILDVPTIELCRRYSVPIVPGTMTPTEIVRAWQAGADLIKVFPLGRLGASYIRDLKGPLPQIKLLATGGVDLDNVGELIRAGASAVGAGTSLVSKEALRTRDFAAMRTTAAEFLKRVQAARQGSEK